MATRTYTVGDQSGIRRLDNLTTPWIDVPLNLFDCKGDPILDILRDVVTDPNDENKVFVCGWRQVSDCRPGIYWSADAGVTWNKALGDIADYPNDNQGNTVWEIWAVNSNVLYATSNWGYCFKSIDGGVTFNHTTTNPFVPGFPAPQSETYSRAIHFADADHGCLAVDLNGGQLHVMVTTDGGNTWTPTDISTPYPTTGLAGGIHMSTDFQTITLLLENGILRSTDGGTTFNPVHVITSPEQVKGVKLLHLTWTDDDNLWAYGTKDLRLRTIDASATWSVINPWNNTGSSNKAGHHYQLPQGFFSRDADAMQTFDESVTGALSETSPYGIEAVWTSVPSSIDPPNDPPCGCPEGYTYNEATEECEQILSVPPNCTNDILNVEPIIKNAQYGQMGTNFFASTVGSALPLTPITAVGGLGGIQDANSLPLSYTRVDASSNNFWGNCNGANPYAFPCTGSSNSGRLNAIGVWSALGGGDPHNEWIGFTTCVTVPETGIYYIGIGSDESSRFSIDGVLFANLAPGSFDEWSVWRVFPVLLTAGDHTIEMEGLNASGPGGFGAEIYKVPNDDVNLLMAVTSEIELAPYLIWNTKQIADVGGFFDLGEDTGCECPEGYALSNCNGYLECITTDTVPFLPCGCWLLTNCEDPEDTVLIQTDPLDPPLDLNLTYVFNSIDPDKCWTVSESELCDPANPLPFSTFDETFDTCEDCVKICYELTDCENLLTPKQTDIDLSAYVGQIITIASCPDTCWIVTELPECPPVVEPVTIVGSFEDCVTCLPAPEPEPPLVIRNRFVKPGYDTPGCPPEYVEKISCDWSESLFQEAVSKRYGIKFCCQLDLDKLSIKKELLDLKMITDPTACETIYEECCPPCNTTATIHVFQTIQCLAPEVTGVILDVPEPVIPNCVEVTLTVKGHPGISYPVTGVDCCGVPFDLLLPFGNVTVMCVDLDQPYTVDPNIQVTSSGHCDCDPIPPFDCYCITATTNNGSNGFVTGNYCDGTPFDLTILAGVVYEPICVRADGQGTKSDNIDLTNLGNCTETGTCEPVDECIQVVFTNNNPDDTAVGEDANYTLCTGQPRYTTLLPGESSTPVCVLANAIAVGPNITWVPTGVPCV